MRERVLGLADFIGNFEFQLNFKFATDILDWNVIHGKFVHNSQLIGYVLCFVLFLLRLNCTVPIFNNLVLAGNL